MPDRTISLFNTRVRSEWVRLRTLIILRWLAITGQILAVVVAVYFIGVELHLGLCALAIGASVLLNIVSGMVLPVTKRLSQQEATLMLLFDILQLVFLLFLTGGLDNPFSLLLLAPVTISATALTMGATVFLGLVAVVSVTVLLRYHLPLTLTDGTVLQLPELFQIGNWIALLLGFVFLAGYARRVTIETYSMSQALVATQMALDRESKLAALGGVVAAAAHEMGTPLATIKLVSSELEEELAQQPDLREDAQLIREQALRLGEILRDMGRAGKDDLLLQSSPVLSLVEEAAEPHSNRGKSVHILVNGSPDATSHKDMPVIQRHPQILHGLRNLVQNAVDFAKANVWLNIIWGDDTLRILVMDDGDGFPADLLSRIGDPFLPRRPRKSKAQSDMRPEYEGMGLGLFIAKTLLERSGANLVFANKDADNTGQPALPEMAKNQSGAIVSVTWNRAELEKIPNIAQPNPVN